MKNKRIKRPSALFYILALTVAVILITSYGSAGIYARYTASTSASDTARVAAYVFELVNGDQTVEIPVTYNADGSGVYAIQVKNDNGVKTCEVAQSYVITASKLTDNIGLSLALYSDESCTVAFDGNGTLPAGSAETDTCYLKISLPANADHSLSSEIDLLKISVSAQQID